VASTRDEVTAESSAQPAEWFDPPDPISGPAVETDAPAAEWLTLPELDEQLAAVSDSDAALDELPPMAPVEPAMPPAPVDAPAAFVPPLVSEPTSAPEPTLLQPLEPLDIPVAKVEPAATAEPIAAPVPIAVSARARSARRIVMVAAALVMGTLVVRQVNHGALSDASPTFVGVTSGESSRTKHTPADQPATPGNTGGSQQAAAGGRTGTTVASGNGTTASTTPGAAGAAGGTATTTAPPAGAGKTTASSAAPATTAAPRPPAQAPASTPGYAAAHHACADFNRAYAARDNGGMTDDQADDVFVNTASEVNGAKQINPSRWGTLYNHALTLQQQLEGSVNATDQQIEDQIALVYNDCKAAA
jgi:hypothetical protein